MPTDRFERTTPGPDPVPVGLVGQVVVLAQRGLTHELAAAALGVSRRTLQVWFSRWPVVREAWDAAVTIPTLVAEAAAMEWLAPPPKTKTTEHFDAYGTLTGRTRTTEDRLPDARMIRFWLERRDPARWARPTASA